MHVFGLEAGPIGLHQEAAHAVAFGVVFAVAVHLGPDDGDIGDGA